MSTWWRSSFNLLPVMAIIGLFYQTFKSRYGNGIGRIICLGMVAIAIFLCHMRLTKEKTCADSGSSLHTQLWFDPVEDFLQYAHTGNPVDVTFGVKELKAFLSFCEACEVDIHLFFEKVGEPILMTPKFGLDDDGSTSNFDAKLVLATMLTSQLHEGNPTGRVPSDGALNGRANNETGSEVQQERSKVQASVHGSDHTKIWSDLSAKSGAGTGSDSRQVQGEANTTSNDQRERFNAMHISSNSPERENVPAGLNTHPFIASSIHMSPSYFYDVFLNFFSFFHI